MKLFTRHLKQSRLAKVETITNHISGIQEYASSDYIPVCAIGCFDFSSPTGKCVRACIAVLGCVLGTLFMMGVALLGWSSFEFDTIQGNG